MIFSQRRPIPLTAAGVRQVDQYRGQSLERDFSDRRFDGLTVKRSGVEIRRALERLLFDTVARAKRAEPVGQAPSRVRSYADVKTSGSPFPTVGGLPIPAIDVASSEADIARLEAEIETVKYWLSEIDVDATYHLSQHDLYDLGMETAPGWTPATSTASAASLIYPMVVPPFNGSLRWSTDDDDDDDDPDVVFYAAHGYWPPAPCGCCGEQPEPLDDHVFLDGWVARSGERACSRPACRNWIATVAFNPERGVPYCVSCKTTPPRIQIDREDGVVVSGETYDLNGWVQRAGALTCPTCVEADGA